jgi:ABC-2 type transport system permease protein
MIIIKHEFKINFKQLLIWSGVIGCLVFGLMLIYPEWSAGMGDMAKIFEKMGSFTKAFGLDKIDMNTATGYYSIESGTMIAIGGAMFSALLGTGMLAKEEATHTAEFLLTTPNSRRHIITQKLLAQTFIIFIFNAFILLVALLGFASIGEAVTSSFFLYHLALLMMQLEIGYLCFGISAFLKRFSFGLGIAISLLLYFISVLANMSDELTSFNYITPFYYSDGARIFSSHSIEHEHVGIGIVVSLLSIIVAYTKYLKKDIAN